MTLSQRLGVVEIATPRHFSFHLLVYRPINVVSFPRLSGTGMTSLTLCFLLLKCQMTVCPSSLHSCVQGTNSPPPSEPPGEIMSFGVSPVNYSDSDSEVDIFSMKIYIIVTDVVNVVTFSRKSVNTRVVI